MYMYMYIIVCIYVHTNIYIILQMYAYTYVYEPSEMYVYRYKGFHIHTPPSFFSHTHRQQPPRVKYQAQVEILKIQFLGIPAARSRWLVRICHVFHVFHVILKSFVFLQLSPTSFSRVSSASVSFVFSCDTDTLTHTHISTHTHMSLAYCQLLCILTLPPNSAV